VRSDFEKASASLANSAVDGRRWTMNDPRCEMRSAAREICRVLKQTNGDGVRQIVVNEETVNPLCTLQSTSSVVTNTTKKSIAC
jgi:hypothetical protein